MITLHHIIFDGWSIGIFFKELSDFYNAYAEGEELSLAPLPIQYADFAVWQRGWLQGKTLKQQVSYWKQQLTDVPDLLDLPTDKPRPKELTFKGDTYNYVFSKKIKNKLNQLAQQNQASLFMVLLAGFQILLHRYTRQKHIVIGSPIAGRRTKETENLIGFFINTLVLKTTFEGKENFIEILSKVKETTFQAYQHQDIYFDQLVDHLNIPRILNRNPLFQVEFSFESLPISQILNLKNLVAENLYLENSFAKFDLRVLVVEKGDILSLHIDYSLDLFDLSTIEKLALHFELLLEGLLQDPYQSIYDVPLLTQEEKQQLLIEWNSTTVLYPEEKGVHELFEKQAQRSPENIAVIYKRQKTYLSTVE